jgi:acetyl esterase/lipase
MIDPELAPLVDLLPSDLGLEDPVAARKGFEAMLEGLNREVPPELGVRIEDRSVPGWEDDPDVPVRIYWPREAAAGPVPGILMIHGGGFVVGNIDTEHVGAAILAANVGALVASVEYRLAPESTYPAAVHDCFAALRFLHDDAAALGVDRARIALVGTSAGGGLSAATALLARDRGGPAVCFQMLHIPELDDRLDTPSMQRFVDSPIWNRPLAEKSWQHYLGDLAGSDDVPPYAAPSRATDLSGLPPAYVSTAENDPLRDEGILYALRMLQSGVSVELHQFPGTFHGSAMVVTADVSRRAQEESTRVLRRVLGTAPSS